MGYAVRPPHFLATETSSPHATMVRDIIDTGRILAERGWVPATSGNISMRLADGSVAITATGLDKGHLVPADILAIDPCKPPPANASAETALHLCRYRADETIGAVIHVHSRAATLLSRRAANSGEVVMTGYELLKAFHGLGSHEAVLRVPVVPNSQDVSALALEVEALLPRFAPAPGFLLAGHGLYAWGRTMRETMRHLEAFDFLFGCELALAGIAV